MLKGLIFWIAYAIPGRSTFPDLGCLQTKCYSRPCGRLYSSTVQYLLALLTAAAARLFALFADVVPLGRNPTLTRCNFVGQRYQAPTVRTVR